MSACNGCDSASSNWQPRARVWNFIDVSTKSLDAAKDSPGLHLHRAHPGRRCRSRGRGHRRGLPRPLAQAATVPQKPSRLGAPSPHLLPAASAPAAPAATTTPPPSTAPTWLTAPWCTSCPTRSALSAPRLCCDAARAAAPAQVAGLNRVVGGVSGGVDWQSERLLKADSSHWRSTDSSTASTSSGR